MAISANVFRKGRTAISIMIEGTLSSHESVRIDTYDYGTEQYEILARDVPIGIFYHFGLTPNRGYYYKVYTADKKGNSTLIDSLSDVTVPTSPTGAVVLVQTNKPVGDAFIEALILYSRVRMGQIGLAGGAMYRIDINEVSPKQYEGYNLGPYCLMIVDDSLNSTDYTTQQIHDAIDSIINQVTTAKVVLISQLRQSVLGTTPLVSNLSPTSLVAAVLI